MPEPVRAACVDAIQHRKNGYALTQGMPVLRDRIQAQVERAIEQVTHRSFILNAIEMHGAQADHWLVSALLSALTTCSWPTISVKLRGRYLRASTR